jgi:hypothetical protein
LLAFSIHLHPRILPLPSRCFALLALALATALGLAGCGDAPTAPVETRGGAAPAADESTLPTLPSVTERDPLLYDEAGCARTGPDEVDCSTTADDLDRALTGTAEDWRSLAGFVGPLYDPDAVSGQVVVLDQTVTAAPADAPTWSAVGLVRNETGGSVDGVAVDATLLAADGTTLETVRAPALVSTLRPGEPAPFELVTEQPTALVAEVRWSTTAEPRAADAPDARLLELATWWDRGADDPEPVDFYLYRDDVTEPLPYLLFGAVTNHGGADLASPMVVAAWMDADGRVVAVAQTDAITDPVAGVGGAALAPGASADFLFVLDERPAAVDVADVLLWGAPR